MCSRKRRVKTSARHSGWAHVTNTQKPQPVQKAWGGELPVQRHKRWVCTCIQLQNFFVYSLMPILTVKVPAWLLPSVLSERLQGIYSTRSGKCSWLSDPSELNVGYDAGAPHLPIQSYQFNCQRSHLLFPGLWTVNLTARCVNAVADALRQQSNISQLDSAQGFVPLWCIKLISVTTISPTVDFFLELDHSQNRESNMEIFPGNVFLANWSARPSRLRYPLYQRHRHTADAWEDAHLAIVTLKAIIFPGALKYKRLVGPKSETQSHLDLDEEYLSDIDKEEGADIVNLSSAAPLYRNLWSSHNQRLVIGCLLRYPIASLNCGLLQLHLLALLSATAAPCITIQDTDRLTKGFKSPDFHHLITLLIWLHLSA